MVEKVIVHEDKVSVSVLEQQGPTVVVVQPKEVVRVVGVQPIEVTLEETGETVTVEQLILRVVVEEEPIRVQLTEDKVNVIVTPALTEYIVHEEVIRVVVGTPTNPITIANYFIERSVQVFGPAGRITRFAMYAEIKGPPINGRLRFFPTDDGTETGDPIFEEIVVVAAEVFLDGSSPAYARPKVDGYVVSGTDYVELNVVKGKRQVMLVGDPIETLEAASDVSIQVHCLVGGKLKPAYFNTPGSPNLDQILARLEQTEQRLDALENP